MNNLELNKTLREEARRLGLCDQWYTRWMTAAEYSPMRLIDMYYEGLDFAIAHHYPSNDFIRSHFDRALLRSNGIIVDERWSLLNPKQAILLGQASSTIRVNAYTVSSVYVRDTSCALVQVKGHAIVHIHIYDEASVEVNNESTEAKVTLFVHQKASYKVGGIASVKVIVEN